MNSYSSRYHFKYPITLVYMLQASEYNIADYLHWFWRTKNFLTVSKRRSLVYTQKSKLLVFCVIGLLLLLAIFSSWLFTQALRTGNIWLVVSLLALIILAPYVVAVGVVVPLWLGEKLVQKPRERVLVAEAIKKLAHHKGTRIAVAGSFGKTSFKEMLATILAESKVVASTPGNMNTLLGTSTFVTQLKGNEEVIIFELGESHVGDVAELSAIVQPDVGIITGINEAHLSTFGTLEQTIATVFELEAFVKKQSLYKNGESSLVMTKVEHSDPLVYSIDGVNGWQVSDIQIGIEGTSFVAMKQNKTVWAKSKLLGRHQIGPLVACIDIAEKLGLNVGNISEGIKNTIPFEHRMQPLQIAGAWVIDDTYNGNIQGVVAGLSFLKSLDAKRKIYVTPGLVEQGSETATIHERIGGLIADTCDVVVLMKNSVTENIEIGLNNNKFKGDLFVVDDPLRFYENLDQFVAHGDIVLMQNDWTDNYA